MKTILSILLGLTLGMMCGRTIKDNFTFDIPLFKRLKKELFTQNPLASVAVSVSFHLTIIIAIGVMNYFFLNPVAYVTSLILMTIIPIWGTTRDQKLTMFLMKHMSSMDPNFSSIIRFQGIELANPDEVYSALTEYIKKGD